VLKNQHLKELITWQL